MKIFMKDLYSTVKNNRTIKLRPDSKQAFSHFSFNKITESLLKRLTKLFYFEDSSEFLKIFVFLPEETVNKKLHLSSHNQFVNLTHV